jgi:uncharacterized membrane protein
MALSPRIKKLIGTVLILIWILFYSLLVMRLAVAILPDAGWLVSLLFYALAGLLWIIPVGLALPWMNRDTRPPPENI